LNAALTLKIRYLFFSILFLCFFSGSSRGQIRQLDSLGRKVKNLTELAQLDSIGFKVKNMFQYMWYRDHDTSYISNYSNRVLLKLIAQNKYNFIRIRDKNENKGIGYRPELGLNLGLGITYSWFSFDMTFNFGIQENNIPDFNFFDVQGTIFTTKFLFETTLQYYFGYQVSFTQGFNESILGDAGIRSDIRTINLALQALYALNYDKYSLKAPFVFSEAQKKSAGSPVFGATFTLNDLASDSSMVPGPVQDIFDERLHLVDLTSISLALSAGYMYTFVYKKHWFLTLGLIPGLGFSFGDYTTEFRERKPLYVSYTIKLISSIGYNGPRWVAGLQVLGNINQERVDAKLPVIIGNGKPKFIIGYRLGKRN
jgi:hypothetical protein